MSPKEKSEEKNLNIKSMGNGEVPTFTERNQGKIQFLTFSYFHWEKTTYVHQHTVMQVHHRMPKGPHK